MKALGRHLVVELYGCDVKILNNAKRLEKIMVRATLKAKATIIDVVFHTFNPHGISGLIVIAESHLAIHTWPEYAFASVDIYTCGDTVDPWKACEYLAKALKAKNTSALEMKRGTLDIAGSDLPHKPKLTPK